MIYLASVYTVGITDESKRGLIQQERFEHVARVTADLWSQGLTVFSPIVHGHTIDTIPGGVELPTSHDFWMMHDLRILDRCERLWVLDYGPWQESKGIGMERTRWAKWHANAYLYNHETRRRTLLASP